MFCDDMGKMGKNVKKIQKRGDMCICVADSLCCTAETNNIVKQLYFNKILKRKKDQA